MDGLLLDTERLGMAVFAELVAVHGLDQVAAEALFLQMVGKSGAVAVARVRDALPAADPMLIDGEWRSAMDAALRDRVPLRPTVATTLGQLSAAGVPMAVVTNTRTERARTHLAHAGLLEHFQMVIGAEPERAPKPDPAPYLAGAAALGLRPMDCAAFEDSDAGTQAAVAAGCRVWQVPDLRPPGEALLDLGQAIAQSLSEAVAAAGLIPDGNYSGAKSNI